MRSHWTIGARIMIGVVSLLALAIVITVVALLQAGSTQRRFDNAINVTVHKMTLANDVNIAEANMVANQRLAIIGAALKSDAVEKGATLFRQYQEAGEQALREITPLLVNAEGRKVTEDLRTNFAAWKPAFAGLEAAARAGNAVEADRIRAQVTGPIFNAIDELSRNLVSLELKQLEEDKKNIADAHTTAQAVILALLGLSVLAGLAVMLVLRRTIGELRSAVAEVDRGAGQVASAAGQIASSSQSLAQGASEQAASLEQTSASSEEINASAHQNNDTSRSAAALVGHAQQEFDRTDRSLDQMVTAMQEINQSSEKISRIIKVIDEVAFQTNILALNAAVEAARAGEAGMGFAVVADEVRSLAQRCAQAAKDTASLIEESVSKSNGGREKVDQVATAIRSVTKDSAKLKELIEEVSASSQEQSHGIEQVSKAILEMQQVTQRVAAGAEESASASEELSAQSAALRDVAQRLSAMVGRASRPAI